jgi:hypothetical protein
MGDQLFELQAPGTGVGCADAGHEHIDFAHLVGRRGWANLIPAIRARFTEHPRVGQEIRYGGVMNTVECSWLGWLLAQFCRLLGTPFAPFRGTDVPMDIVLRDAGSAAMVWERVYHYAGRKPLRVASVKRLDTDGTLLECVGFGLGMRLAVFEANRALHFLSLRYFWNVAGRRLWLPRWLTPGTTHVIHTDLGGGRFRFTMTINHEWLGPLFHQEGVFERAQGA